MVVAAIPYPLKILRGYDSRVAVWVSRTRALCAPQTLTATAAKGIYSVSVFRSDGDR